MPVPTALKTRRLIASYAWDWGLVLVCLVVYGSLNLISPFQRFYFQSDTSIQYPHLGSETIPTWLLFVLALVVPLVTIVAVSMVYRKSYRELHLALLAFFVAVIFTALVTEILKNSVGRFRPDFLNRCLPADKTTDNAPCTGDPSIIKNGRKSFPSGHASMSFSGLGYLSFYLAGKVRMLDLRGYVWKALVTLVPVLVALYVAVSRTQDYVHHWQDVTVGGILGYLFAYFSYRYYYPALASRDCGDPYDLRSKDMKPLANSDDIEATAGGNMRMSGGSTREVDP